MARVRAAHRPAAHRRHRSWSAHQPEIVDKTRNTDEIRFGLARAVEPGRCLRFEAVSSLFTTRAEDLATRFIIERLPPRLTSRSS
jgi:hypothetical protein